MNFIITTDTHLGHEKLLRFRPKGFESLILDNLEDVANHETVLIHLGDVCWKKDRFWNRALTSIPFKRKWLVKGNHDYKKYPYYINNGWDFVGESLMLQHLDQDILFTHKPVPVDESVINIHGHFHEFEENRIQEVEPELLKIHKDGRHILLAVESNDYKPFNLDTVMKKYFRELQLCQIPQ